MIIGITGNFCAGKDSVAEYLYKKDFTHISLADMLREEQKKRKKPLTRTNLQNLGNELREKYGNGILAEKANKKIKPNKNYIITSIRHPDEIKTLRYNDYFFLIKVLAPIKLRFERMKKRNRENDPDTFEGFKRIEHKEMNGTGNDQRLKDCFALSKINIINDSNFEDLFKKIDKLIEDLKQKISTKRVKWDEYFLKLALVVAERATCVRHHIGALAVKDRRILATGYNGTVSGLNDCLKLGCIRNKLKIPSGEKHEVCRAVHAEQNLVVQAALHGSNLKDATIYCTHSPCLPCAKLLANTKIKRFVTCSDVYPSEESIKLFERLGIKFEMHKIPSNKISILL